MFRQVPVFAFWAFCVYGVEIAALVQFPSRLFQNFARFR